jgi:hypothetical protein
MATRFDAVIGQPINLTYYYYVNNVLTTPYLFEKVEIFRVRQEPPYGAQLVETIPSANITETSTGKFSYVMSPVAIPGQYYDKITILPTAPSPVVFTVTASLNLSLNPANWLTDRFINIPNGYNIDGHHLADGDTVLLFGQIQPYQNGIFVYNATTKELTRHPSFDSPNEFVLNDLIGVSQGSRAGKKYRTALIPTTLNTDPIAYSLFADPVFTDQITFEVFPYDSSISGSAPSVVPVCRVYGQILQPDGKPMVGCLVTANISIFPARLNNTSYAIGQEVIRTATNNMGKFYIDIPRGLEVRFLIRDILLDTYVKIPDAPSVNLFSLSPMKDIGDLTTNDTTASEANW